MNTNHLTSDQKLAAIETFLSWQADDTTILTQIYNLIIENKIEGYET